MIYRVTQVEISDYSDMDNPEFHVWENVNASFKISGRNGVLKIFIAKVEDDESL